MANPTITDNDSSPLVLARAEYDERTITSGQGTLAKGSVMGIVSADGKLTLCDDASSDGSEVAKAVLVREVDASSEVTDEPVLIAGNVDADQLVFGGDDTVDDHFDELRDVAIIPVDTQIIGAHDND